MREADDLVVAEVFGRLDRDAALPGMRAAFEEFRPDVVLREPAELASYVVATEHGVPHVQTSTGLSVLEDRLLPLVVPTLDEVGCPSAGLLSAPRWTVVPPVLRPACRSSDGDGDPRSRTSCRPGGRAVAAGLVVAGRRPAPHLREPSAASPPASACSPRCTRPCSSSWRTSRPGSC
jgi:hypothetical protein